MSYNNPQGRSIDERPFTAKERRFGDWEMDTVVGRRGTKTALLVLTERYSRYEIIIKLESKTKEEVVKALNKLEEQYKDRFSKIFKTITVDNGVEFLDTHGLEKSIYSDKQRTTIYYAHAYSSCERGSNENNNRFIRKFIKKGMDIGKFTVEYIQYIQDWMNKYPRRIFNYNCAENIFTYLAA